MAMSTTPEKHQPMLLTLLTVYRLTGSPWPLTKGWLLQLSPIQGRAAVRGRQIDAGVLFCCPITLVSDATIRQSIEDCCSSKPDVR